MAFPNCPIWNAYHDMNLHFEYENVIVQTANFLCQKKFSIGDLKRVLAGNFAKNKSVLQALYNLAPYKSFADGHDNYMTQLSCDDQCCENWKSRNFFIALFNAAYLMYSQTSIGFGTFLSTFANLTNAKIDDRDWSIFDLEKVIKSDQSERICSKMSKTDKFLSSYFKDLGMKIGFDENHTLSLFDLPSILSSAVHSGQSSKKETKENFMFSQCEMKTLTPSDFHFCLTNKWFQFVDKGKTHPCNTTSFNEWSTNYGIEDKCCFFWTSILKHKIKPIMRVMRMASGRGQSHFNFSDFIQPFLENENNTVRYPLDLYTRDAFHDGKEARDKTSFLPGRD